MSNLWWKFDTEPGNAYNVHAPFFPSPVYQLMSGSIIADPSLIDTLVSASWSAVGGPQVAQVTLYDTASNIAPINGAVIKVWNVGFFNDTNNTSSLTPDGNGFTSASLVVSDLTNALFTPYTEIGATIIGSYRLGFRATFSLAETASVSPFVVNVNNPGTGSFTASLVNITFQYATTDSTGSRRGLIINAWTGSPQIALEPVNRHPDQLIQGDIWFAPRLPTSGTNSGLFYADIVSGSGPTATVLRHKVISTREDIITTQSLFNLYLSQNAPTGVYVALNGFAVDDWLMSVGPTGSHNNSGWMNATWQGGIWMLDINTIAIYGANKNFYIPSGSVTASIGFRVDSGGIRIISGGLNIDTGNILLTGSINVLSGSISIVSGDLILSGNNADFIISGSQATARLRGNNILNVIVSGASSQSILPIPANGTLYVDTTTFIISVRESDQWYTISSGTLTGIIDGGSY